ncbi:MAG TPA: endopeptidase La [Acidimicrobiia bacterium]|jgi:ATP-dependent Lon protease|nr:endopeptidase La [Acidimicrobiia bacterium]
MADTSPSLDERLVLPLLPLSSGVVLPQMVVTLALESDDARRAAEAAGGGDGQVLLVPRVEGRYARVGTVARIESAGELPNGVQALLLRGLSRAVVGVGVAGTDAALWVEAEPVAEPAAASPRAQELSTEYRAIVSEIATRLRAGRLAEAIQGVTDPGALADTAGWWPDLAIERKVELLETLDVEARLEAVVAWARDALAELEVADRIRSEVTDGMEAQQKEFLLRRQMDAIRKELGENDGDVVSEFRRTLEERDLPEAIRDAATRELDRLERTSEQSPEHGWIRTWLDTLLEVPWGERSDDNLDVGAARRILDADHTGLEDVKDRIVEFLAVRKLRADRGLGEATGRGVGAILALVGPPGVGKTSLGESIARALGRKFTRVALGGVHDEAEIRGHRRTYVGARPGRVVRALTEAGTMNPVIVLDEVDKLGADWRGDPSSALLEVLDPAQNHTFRDHYLEVDLDLSQVLFIATANLAETIPGPLLDRLEVIRLDGYTEDEKVAIARDHLLDRQLERNGLGVDDVTIDDGALRRIVTDYTREAGVRNLERELGKLLRKVAARLVSGDATAPVVVDADAVPGALGRPRFFAELADRTATPGVATGLAVTGTGGDVLFIEATAMAGEPGLTLTGQLGDVMKESAQIALSYVQGHADALGVNPADAARRFHVHVPAGAIPKDGPSAGVTMTTALASLLTGRPVRPDVGMTGEVTLQGRVLPIGGVKQKVLAAQRAGLTTVILPARNGPDLDDVPAAVREQLTFHLVDDVAEVLDLALATPDQALAA